MRSLQDQASEQALWGASVAICMLNEAAEHAGAQHAGVPVAVLASGKLASPPLRAWFLAEGFLLCEAPQSAGLSSLLFACMHAP